MNQTTIRAHIADHPVVGSPEDMRAAFARLAGTGPEGEIVQQGGVDCVMHGSGNPVLWLHGGGYVFGAPETHAKAADYLARRAGRSVWVPRYRRAPEHPWPAMLEDALAVLSGFPDPLPVVGDSAGGHLALNLAIAAPGRVSLLALLSPNTDRSGLSRTRAANTPRDAMNDDVRDRALWRQAMPDAAPDDAAASPLLADLSALPPVWLRAVAHEVLLDDTLLMTSALARTGVPVTAGILPGLFHMWTLWPDALPEARQTLDALADYIQPL